MAVVYLAHDEHLGRQVAIKVLSADLSSAVDAERFGREISVLARLVHPNIVALFDSGETDGRIYYVMPYVSGDTLRARLLAEGRIPPREIAGLGADVAEALAYAHGAGVVHRDVKPENIFTSGGRAILGDFGIAQVTADYAADAVTSSLTTRGLVLGTLAYISPEQASGEGPIDGRSDLYSLGCVLYEAVAGAAPFAAQTPVGLLARHLTHVPPPLVEGDDSVPPALSAIISRMLAKQAGERPVGAGDVARALRGIAEGQVEPARSGSPGITSRPEHRAVRSPSRARVPEVERLVTEGIAALNLAGAPSESSPRQMEEARTYLARALALDPGDAGALAGMARLLLMKGVAGIDREASFAAGRQHLFAALAADDQRSDVHSTFAKNALYLDNDFHAAARHLRRAAELTPDDPEVLRVQSIVEKILAHPDAAVLFARKAVALAPDVATFWNALGDVLLAAGRNAEAVEALTRAIALMSGYLPALERLELAYVRLGDAQTAIDLRLSRLRIGRQVARVESLERDALDSGPEAARRADVRRDLETLLDAAGAADPFAEYLSSRNAADRIVIAYAELGEWHKAMDWVERAYARHPGRLRRMLTDHPYDHRGLAADPRYARLLRVAGLEELL